MHLRSLFVLIMATSVLLALFVAYQIWAPGLDVTDGHHDRGRNGIWMQHGWLSGDDWFIRNGKESEVSAFRNIDRLHEQASFLRQQHIADVFPHVSPVNSQGILPSVDHQQVERFLDAFHDFNVLPWTGGVIGKTVMPSDPNWRNNFIHSIIDFISRHPRIAGIHINIEPWPSGDRALLSLIADIRHALPKTKRLSLAAYPPPTKWHPFPEVHWSRSYYRKLSRYTDQFVVMMYDTGLPLQKIYGDLIKGWTKEVLNWSGGADVLLGVPVYDDAGVGYHRPSVESLENALRGIHAGLETYPVLPSNYQGVAIYSEWEMDSTEWKYWRQHFLDSLLVPKQRR